jgi:phosphoglycolate phosphatase
MAVASNKPARFSIPILDQVGLLTHLHPVLGPDIVGAAKPDPAMIRACLDTLSVSTGEAVYVGDMVLDVESAARAGLPVLLVSGGSSSREELEQTGQRLLPCFASLGEILLSCPS